VIALDEPHLRRLLRDYVNYHHTDRIHDSLPGALACRMSEKDAPNRRAMEPKPVANGNSNLQPASGV
jgi:hypothetical protein